MVLKSLHAGKRGGTGEKLVGEVTLVLVLIVVHITVSLVRFVCVLLALPKVECRRETEVNIPQPQAILLVKL